MSWQRPKRNKKRILLIYPNQPGKSTTSGSVFPFPFLGLTQIAAFIPDDYDARIMDERLAPVRGKEKADIVFITVLTVNAPRAYALGDLFKNRGIQVIMGGVHATLMPEEASNHATSVVIGEAEYIMEELLNDFEKNQLKPTYQASCLPDLERVPDPALHLLNWRHRFFLSPIQTSRGCPHNCSFCSVPVAFGRKLRLKSLAKLESELKFLTRFRPRKVFVVDDNFTLNKEHAMAIMDLFHYYGFQWMGFSNLAVSDDEEFMRAMHESHCLSLFIGFESLHGQGLLPKNRPYSTPETIRDAVHRLHEHNIGIQGSFIFGFDEDTINVFKETVSFIQETGIELPTINILTPLPGTPLFHFFEKENRLIHKNWSLYDLSHIVFEPKNMSVEELQQGFAWALKYLASPTSILKRLRKRFASMNYFLLANFSLHKHQTRLANSLWNPDIQSSMQKRGLCLS